MKARLLLLLGTLALSLGLQCTARALPAAAELKGAFAALDADHDGSISLREWENASFALFRSADRNNDNSLDPSELGGTTITQDTFLLVDDDHNGRLSIAEFMRLRRAVFTAADIDRGDTLSPVEFELLTLLAQTGWTDRNHNGRIEPSELKAALTQAFGQLDENHDGFLSAAEAGYMPADQFKLSDLDHDDRLSQDEFVTGYLKSLGAL
jgi:Ca2+-binding EF-hand superfamily protein